jgi:hypothetical protein
LGVCTDTGEQEVMKNVIGNSPTSNTSLTPAIEFRALFDNALAVTRQRLENMSCPPLRTMLGNHV